MASGEIRLARATGASDVLFRAVNYTAMATVCVLTVFPFLHVLGLSLQAEHVAYTQSFSLIPRSFSLAAYRKVIANELIWIGYRNTILRIALGTSLSLVVMVALAYALSKRRLPNRRFWTFVVVFTMFFQGGLIPSYLLIRSLGLMDTVWSMVLPPLVNTFTMIVMRNYFMTVPASLEESAKIDGAGDLRILFRIVLPVSLPIVATVTLWTMVWHWNAWFDCVLYIQRTSRVILQVVLRRIVLEGTMQIHDTNPVAGITLNPEVVKAATVIFATAPILVIYPFVQKYFVRGIMVGSLKG